jgi:hypothetical protein
MMKMERGGEDGVDHFVFLRDMVNGELDLLVVDVRCECECECDWVGLCCFDDGLVDGERVMISHSLSR